MSRQSEISAFCILTPDQGIEIIDWFQNFPACRRKEFSLCIWQKPEWELKASWKRQGIIGNFSQNVRTCHWFIKWPFTELAPSPGPPWIRTEVAICRNNKFLDSIFLYNMKIEKGNFMTWCKWTTGGRNKTLFLEDRYVFFAVISCNTEHYETAILKCLWTIWAYQ